MGIFPDTLGGTANERWKFELRRAETAEELMSFNADRVTNQGHAACIGLPAGSYYITVRDNSITSEPGMPSVLCTLQFCEDQDITFEQEPNNESTRAQLLSLDEFRVGALQDRSNADPDDYKFSLDEAREIQFDIATRSGEGTAAQRWNVPLRHRADSTQATPQYRLQV